MLGSFLSIADQGISLSRIVTIDVNPQPLKNESKIPKQFHNLNSRSCSDIIDINDKVWRLLGRNFISRLRGDHLEDWRT